MNKNRNRVCPVEMSGCLDVKLRKIVQNPGKILSSYISKGMKVLEIGCGPGFFIPDMASLVGSDGIVVASDLQEGMLEKVRDKLKKTEFGKRVIYHKCEIDCLNIKDKFDFILLFWMVHEVTDKISFFKEIQSILLSKGKVLIVEPYVHVSKKDFRKTVEKALNLGFYELEAQKIFFSRTVVLQNLS